MTSNSNHGGLATDKTVAKWWRGKQQMRQTNEKWWCGDQE
jgi:hypothetical protein